ncbi:MAG: ThuA domain-containing protein [Nocardioides sp.]|nr:ThuA domain-containing protein [Nocardioides sp.]
MTSYARRTVLAAAGATAVTGALASGPARAASQRDQRVIVFTKTSGYRHACIPDAIAALSELAADNGIYVVATEDAAIFTPAELAKVTAVVFASTTGIILTAQARASIEAFVTSGGGWMGIHSAADTEYDWPFYTSLLSGGRFLCHPLVNQSGTVVRESGSDISTAHLPARWAIGTEEFYSFTTDVRGTAEVLLSLDESTYHPDPNTSLLPSGSPPYRMQIPTTGRMGDHPLAWRTPVGAGLSWYTALGHEPTLYADARFRQHLLGGLLTVSRHGQASLPS